MHYLDETHIQLFLLQLVLLLGVARTLGVACQSVGIPALAGEILTGFILGPTLLGRISPEWQSALFPDEVIQMAMLEAHSSVTRVNDRESPSQLYVYDPSLSAEQAPVPPVSVTLMASPSGVKLAATVAVNEASVNDPEIPRDGPRARGAQPSCGIVSCSQMASTDPWLLHGNGSLVGRDPEGARRVDRQWCPR